MSQERELYNALIESGDLKTMYISMTGNWEKDKKSFGRQYQDNMDIINLTMDNDHSEKF